MHNYNLTPTELWTIERVRLAEEADFLALPVEFSREIAADVVRCLMLGLPLGRDENGVKVSGMGLRLKNAAITGLLNLEHGSLANGDDMPKLSLENCEIKDGINLKSAKIQRLCLKGSMISELIADHVHISGLLDIRFLKAHPLSGKVGIGKSPQPLCRLRLCGAHIEDGIEAGGAHLVGPPFSTDYRKYSERAPYALDLPEAHINGDIRLFPDFTACGGVSINGAVISGSFQAHGAHFTYGQLYSLDASGAVIHGSLALDSRIISPAEHANANKSGKVRPGAVRFVCEGQLRLNNVVIDEDLRLHGARICGEKGRITAQHITVRGDACFCAFDNARGDQQEDDEFTPSQFPVAIFSFECRDRIDLRGANIIGDVSFKGATLGGELAISRDQLGGNLDISSSRIGGHLIFSPMAHLEKAKHHPERNRKLIQRFISGVHIKLDGTEVVGNLDLRGARLRGDLQAYGLKVRGYANLAPYEPEDKDLAPWPLEAEKIIFDSAIISQKLDMSGASLRGEFLAPNLEVGGKLLMCGHARRDGDAHFFWFDAKKRVNLSGANIKSDFDLTGARLAEGLRFRGGRVESALIFDIYDFPGNERLPTTGKLSIDLLNAHANILLDLHYFRNSTTEKGDALRLGYTQSYFLRLEGFTYGRFPHYADGESLAASEKERRDNLRKHLARALNEVVPVGALRRDLKPPSATLKFRRTWLNWQYRGAATKGKRKPTRENYNPDPYNTLYKFYKRMGAQALADKILIDKLNIEAWTNPSPTMILSGFFLGYGLKPLRPLLCYLVVTTIATVCIWSGNNPGEPISAFFAAASDLTPSTASTCTPLSALTQTFHTLLPSFGFGADVPCHTVGAGAGLLLGLFGWIMAPFTVLTWTGFIRRNAEP